MLGTSKKRTPMQFAARSLSMIMDMIDNSENVDQFLIEEFKQADLEISEAVDRRIAVLQRFKSEIEHLKRIKAQYEAYIKVVQNADTRCREYTKWIMIENPEVPYKGELGKLALQESPSKLNVDFGLETKYFTSVVDDKDLLDFKIPKEFLKKQVVYQLDKEAVKIALKETKRKLPWARLSRDKHIRIKR